MKNTITINKNAQTTVGAGLDSARGCRGITLIALIITVIVLLILAGVALNFIVGQNGILTHSETSKQQYELASAREELEMVIADIQTEIIKTEGRKATLVDLENRIDKNKYSIILSTDPIATTTAVSTNYTYASVVLLEKEIEFTVDAKLIIREVELVSVKQGTAEVEIETKIKEYVGKDENNKYRVKYEITLSTMQGVKSITVESGEEKQELTIDENLTKEVSVEIGKVYTIKVTMEDGKYKRKTIYDRATETIKTAEELAQFRDKVNSGLSYEGKTVELANDIDLQGSDTNQWIPIGITTPFKGVFDGINKKVKNIFINTARDNNGLFGYIENAAIKNLRLENGSIKLGVNTAGICSYSNQSTITNCINNTSIEGTSAYTAGISAVATNSTIQKCINIANILGTHGTGGIVGLANINTNILNSYNSGVITSKNSGSVNVNYISGGIVGYTNNLQGDITKIENCYNTGAVYGKTHTGGISGLHQGGGIHIISNCYSKGVITGNNRYGISGLYNSGNGTPQMSLANNYWLSGCGVSSGSYHSGNTNATVLAATTLQSYATTLGSAYTNDVKIKVKDETTGEEKEVWKYNDGYPILKWQLETN